MGSLGVAGRSWLLRLLAVGLAFLAAGVLLSACSSSPSGSKARAHSGSRGAPRVERPSPWPPPPPVADGAEWTDERTRMVWVAIPDTPYLLGKTEVTVGQYRACVEAGACTTAKLKGTEWKEKPWAAEAVCEWGLSEREDHPINCVDWHQANQFCRWAGGRLPSMDEFLDEATNGGLRSYPWGDGRPSCDLAVMDDRMQHVGERKKGCGRGSAWPVCSKPQGNSVHGLCDVGGNVWEWTDTLELSDTPPRYNLGGSWGNGARMLENGFELINPTMFRIHVLGMRCRRARAAKG